MEYDSIIVGSGMAGLTAGLYLARAKKNILIIENSVIGGITATLENIENYPGYESVSGMELVQKTFSQVSKLGVNIDLMTINKIDFDKKIIFTRKNELKYKTLIIASGTSYKNLNLPEEDNYKFKGLSYCAICDGALYKNKSIIVVTNGLSGASSIEYLSNLSDNITVVDTSNEYKSDRFTTYSNAKVIRINGDPFVESIDIIVQSGEVLNLQCNGLFVCLGKETNTSLYNGNISLDNGYIISDENMHTNIEGVFVAGDIRKKSLRQIITACSDGAIAATEALKYLNK